MSLTTKKIYRVAVIGATGYGGLQSIKLLQGHPNFEISYLGGRKSAGKFWNDLNPFLAISGGPQIHEPDPVEIAKSADFAILSLPNGFSSQLTPKLLDHKVRVIDLSADYRFSSLEQWKNVYLEESAKYDRADFDLCKDSVYGISEWFHEEISNSNLVSCPGCFPTASLLALLPFLKQGLIETDGLIIDAKTGTSGGGRTPKEHLLLSESSECLSAYGVIGHRHRSEIEAIASNVSGQKIEIQFTPHLVPMIRGLYSTVYGRLRDPGLTAEDCTTVLNAFYKDQPFIKVLPVGTYPSTKWARNTNSAYLSVQVDKRNGRLVLLSAIDNLLKGQAGQAVQNLNIMCNLDQQIGLPAHPFYP